MENEFLQALLTGLAEGLVGMITDCPAAFFFFIGVLILRYTPKEHKDLSLVGAALLSIALIGLT